jgi:Retrotransposon gag protein
MNVYRVGPITKNLSHNYNLRSQATKTANTVDKHIITDPKFLVHNQTEQPKNTDNIRNEFIDFYIANLFPDLINMAAPAANAAAPAQVVRELRGLTPPKFEGHMQDNATWWLQKFEAFVAQQAIQGDDRVRVFVLFLSGPCENWFMLLPDNQKDTYEHLRAAFLARYTGQLNNRATEELFYSKYQLQNESAETYINNMLTLGNKLQLNENTMVNTIKRGLIPAIRVHVLSHNVGDVTSLFQQATLAESYQHLLNPNITTGFAEQNFSQNRPTAAANVTNATVLPNDVEKLKQDSADIKTMVGTLTQLFDRMNISNMEQQQATAANSRPTGYQQIFSRPSRQFNKPNYPTQRPTLFCNFCYFAGHTYENCRRRQQARFAGQIHNQYRLQPRFLQNNSWGNRPRYIQPQPQAYIDHAHTEQQTYNIPPFPYQYNQQSLN